MVAPAPALRSRSAAFAVPAFALAYAIVVVVVPRSQTGVLTTYAGASVPLHAADLVAGMALIAAGALAFMEPRAWRVGLLAILAGIAWFGPDWEGWEGGPAVVRSLGALAAPFVLALLFHLVLAFPRRRLQRGWAYAAVIAVYVVAAVVSVGRALFRDPFLDPYCWRNCTDNVFLVHRHEGIAQALDDVWLRAAVAIGILLVAIGVGRMLVAGAAARRTLWAVIVPGALAGGAEAAYAIGLIHNRFENPNEDAFSSLFFARSASLTLLALGLTWTVGQTHRRRVIVSRLAADLGETPPPGKLQDALAAAVGDAALRVAYWLPGSRRFVGSDGKAVERPAPQPGRAVTPIMRAGQPVALIQHDSAVLGGQELEREIGSAARLAVDNERLQAEVLAQLDDLRASRARIVETGDAERRRLERDLHDGAQQRLLAVSYDLRLARAGAEADGEAGLSALLAAAADEAQAALAELRELAHGIYPAILAEAGLGPALATLADEAPLPVELAEVPDDRYDAPIETVAYLTVAQAIADAAGRKATAVAVDVKPDGDRLVVTVRDDGAPRSSPLVHLADRVGALGGSLELDATSLRVAIACA